MWRVILRIIIWLLCGYATVALNAFINIKMSGYEDPDASALTCFLIILLWPAVLIVGPAKYLIWKIEKEMQPWK